MKKYITKGKIIYFVVWAIVFGGLYIFIQDNPEYVLLDTSKLIELDGQMMYLEDAMIKPPPPSYKIYLFQEKWGGLIRILAWIAIAIILFINRKHIKEAIKWVENLEN